MALEGVLDLLSTEIPKTIDMSTELVVVALMMCAHLCPQAVNALMDYFLDADMYAICYFLFYKLRVFVYFYCEAFLEIASMGF